MERTRTTLKKKAYYATKLKQATHLLFFKHHHKPGVKGWELRKRLGEKYPKILDLLNRHLEKFDLQVKTVFESKKPSRQPTKAQLDKARFYVTLRGNLNPTETKMMGWRIDDIAGLAITVSTIMAKKGKASRREVERLLADKFVNWKVTANLNRYKQAGYIDEDEKGLLHLDWRTRAEIDEKNLLDSLMHR